VLIPKVCLVGSVLIPKVCLVGSVLLIFFSFLCCMFLFVFVYLRSVCPMLPVSLDCPFLICTFGSL
jgi:hypothetical protein